MKQEISVYSIEGGTHDTNRIISVIDEGFKFTHFNSNFERLIIGKRNSSKKKDSPERKQKHEVDTTTFKLDGEDETSVE